MTLCRYTNVVLLLLVLLLINWKTHETLDLNFTVKDAKLHKFTGSHVHWKSGNTCISETVLDRDVVTTGH